MKNLKFLLSMFLLLCSIVVSAHDFEVNGIYYNITDAINKTVEVAFKESDSNSYTSEYTGSVVIPESVTYNGTTYSVTNIERAAFLGCSGLTNVEIPNSVTSIEFNTFFGCSSLTSITIPNSVTTIEAQAFYNCTGLTSIEMSNSVTSIGSSAFAGCSSLTSISVPNSVTSIEFNAFAGCSSLTSITMPNSVTNIADGTFSGCSSLTSITMPNSVTSIGDYAFYGCSSLTSILIPQNVTSIGEDAFNGCENLKTVLNFSNLTFCEGSSDYGYVAFYANEVTNAPNGFIEDGFLFAKPDGINTLLAYLGNDTELILPQSCNGDSYEIGAKAFKDNTTITSVVIPKNVASIGNYAFYNCSALKTVINCSNLTLSKGLSTNGYVAFYADKVIDGLIEGDYIWGIIDNVNTLLVYLGNDAELTLPQSYNEENYVIGDNAFKNNTTLISITIPNSITSIGSEAFWGCKNLAYVYCLATMVPSTDSSAFDESCLEYMTLHVPTEAINDYKTAAPWSCFGNIVTKCATPTISYSNGELVIECETEEVEFITEVTSEDFNKFFSDRINFSATYNISVYATASGYTNSETVNATLCWIENGNSNDETNVINVPATAVFITSSNGALYINSSLEGEEAAVYTSGGTLVGKATITNGNATVQSGLSKGSIAIVKIGEKSVKVILN